MRRIFLTMLPVVKQQMRILKTCQANFVNKLTLLDVHRKPHVTRFYRRVEVDIDPLEEVYKRSFRKAAMHHHADTFKLNGFIEPMSCLGAYNQTTKPPHYVTNWKWYVTSKDRGEPVKQSGGGLGKLDAKGEAGFFHKVNSSRLEQIKKMLREKRLSQQQEAPKDDTKK